MVRTQVQGRLGKELAVLVWSRDWRLASVMGHFLDRLDRPSIDLNMVTCCTRYRGHEVTSFAKLFDFGNSPLLFCRVHSFLHRKRKRNCTSYQWGQLDTKNYMVILYPTSV
ncbi:hypothetical protein MPTK1_5g01550 [Marchantia polymorpha subsp. ruderalis]|uniref:Uncharacterized protein n=1 Tax=Marchantia polymorpha subsp. ruderalis TaxID=1480154 RepID=A0AAF6BDU2_MARPO|nr:hypothetical protein Mp_5g01550 [Marchantia polymorpha subsp. ruderalis]